MAGNGGRRANAYNMTKKRLVACQKQDSSVNPVTPRRQLLMDRLASVERKAHTLASENAQLKENYDALSTCANDLGCKLHNKSRQANRTRASANELRAELNRSKHARVVQAGRLDRRKVDGIGKAMKQARLGLTKRWMKGKGGVFTEPSREMFRELVALKVSPENLDPVIHTVGSGLGLQVQDHVSARQIGRVMEEAGIASDIQVVMEINTSKGTGRPITRILDITSAPDHTSEAQLAGWQDVLVKGLINTYNASPLGQVNPIDEDEFITFIKGLGTNHANDQKKLARLINEGTTNSQKLMMGKRYLSNTALENLMPTIARFNDEKITAAGGLDAWTALPDEETVLRDIQ
ncbi:hypothetical protein B0H14DRAFT_2649010, partial [Mycena olivaceomarginata]